MKPDDSDSGVFISGNLFEFEEYLAVLCSFLLYVPNLKEGRVHAAYTMHSLPSSEKRKSGMTFLFKCGVLFSNDSFANFKFNLLTIERYKNDLCLLCASCIYCFPPKKRLTNDKKNH